MRRAHHRPWPAVLALILLAGPLAGILAAEGSVILKPNVEILGREILLREVALVKSAGEELADRLNEVSLGRAPNPGYTRYIPREQVAARLHAEGFHPGEVKIEGARGVLVGIKTVMLSGGELMRLGKDFLRKEVSGLTGERVIEPAHEPSDFLAPMGKGLTTYEVRWHGVPKNSGTVSVDARVLVDGALFTTVPLHFNIRLFETALVAVEEVPRGGAFTAMNTTVLRTEVTQVQGRVAQSLEEMRLYCAKRNLPAGSIIRIEDAVMPDLVVRGRPVYVSVTKGSLTIRSRGVARQNGALGATVEILNPDSQRSFKARVIGLNQVEVQL